MDFKANLDLVPGSDHYAKHYLRYGRAFSYAHQLDQVLRHDARRVLEVGPGGGIVTFAMRRVGIEVVTADIQPDLRPDVLASVTDLPFADRSFDVAMCCQVLEHLPFEHFERSVRELWRVTRGVLLVSLPDARAYFEARLRLPLILNWRSATHLRRPLADSYRRSKLKDDGHYWEIGYRGYPERRVRRTIASATGVKPEVWSVSENHYHRFFKTVRPDAGRKPDLPGNS